MKYILCKECACIMNVKSSKEDCVALQTCEKCTSKILKSK